MEIPYVVKERPDTGLNNAKMAIWLFLASEVMLFGALFATYIFIRVLSPDFASMKEMDLLLENGETYRLKLNVPLAMLNTFVLITSSVTMVLSWAALKMNNPGKSAMWLAVTFLCGIGFMVIKAMEYGGKFKVDVYPSLNNFYGIYYTMTGLHGLHVVGGMVVMGYFLLVGKKMWNTEPERYAGRIEVTGLYWHFVDLVWIFLFPVLYLL